MEHTLKRKRDVEYPRLTYNAGDRTFDRLLKEDTLEEMKTVVRKKLGYPVDMPLQLAQLRDGKTIDLEDDDDFDALCAVAYSSSVVVVQVTVPRSHIADLEDTQSLVADIIESSAKERKRKPDLDETLAPTQGNNISDIQTPAKKRRVSFVENKSTLDMDSEPPKKKRRANIKNSASRKDGSESVTQPLALSMTGTTSRTRSKASKSSIVTNHVQGNDTGVVPNLGTDAHAPPGTHAGITSKSIKGINSTNGVDDQAQKKDKKDLASEKTPRGTSNSHRARKLSGTRPDNTEEFHNHIGDNDDTSAASKTGVNGRSKSKTIKDRIISPEETTAQSSFEEMKDEGKDQPKEKVEKNPLQKRWSENDRSAVQAAFDRVLARLASANPESNVSSEQQVSAAMSTKNNTKPSQPPVPHAPPLSCPICHKAPAHARSKCPLVRGSVMPLQKRLLELQKDKSKGKDGSRSRLIEELQNMIENKTTSKTKSKASSSKTKVVSDHADISGVEKAALHPQSLIPLPSEALKNATNKTSNDDSSSEDEPLVHPATLPKYPISAAKINLGNVSYTDRDLEAVIRGPNVPLSVGDLPSSDTSGDEQDEQDEREDLMDDEEETEKRPRIQLAQSSDEGEEEEEDDQTIRKVATRPPRMQMTPRTQSPSTPVSITHQDLSFHDVNDLGSSVEIDKAADRAFSEVLTGETSVVKFAFGEVFSTAKNSGEADARSKDPISKNGDKAETPAVTIELQSLGGVAETAQNCRQESIELPESPNKPPTSPIETPLDNDVRVLQSTPCGVVQRMKDRWGNFPDSPSTDPKSSLNKALKLLNGINGSEGSQKSNLGRTRSSSRLATALSTTPVATEQINPTIRVIKAVSERTDQQVPSIVSINSPKINLPAIRKPPIEPSLAEDTTIGVEETSIPFNTWEVLKEDSSLPEETITTMTDELRSSPGSNVFASGSQRQSASQDKPTELLFIPSESQNSFPYSQWNGPNKDFQMGSGSDSEDEEEIETSIVKTQPSTQNSFRRLTDIASQRTPFQTRISDLPLPRPARFSRKETMADLLGRPLEENSEGSESDSESESELKVQKSHIPNSRRAGLRMPK